MASIYKYRDGYRAMIRIKGKSQSAVFKTKREATEWAIKKENEILVEESTHAGDSKTLREAIKKYSEEVSIKKKGSRWEIVRLNAFAARKTLPLDIPLNQVKSHHIAEYRDSRLNEVQNSSVLRELVLLSSVFQAAKIDWGWFKGDNPCHEIRKPQAPKHRERTLTVSEIRAMLTELDYSPYIQRPTSVKQVVAFCMIFALRTGMRAGELAGLEWRRVHDNYALLEETKNGTSRDVPLSKKAQRVINKMDGWHHDLVFGITTYTLDAMYRRARGRAGLEGFTFHDLRHTAATMLAKKLEMLDLCKMFGWKNPKMALVYYNPKINKIVDLLNK